MSLLSTKICVRTCVTLAALLLLLSGPAVALANGPEIGFDAGGVFPLQSQSIQLVSESVTIFVGGHGPARARCDYTLKNLTALPHAIQMGFIVNAGPGFLGPLTYASRYHNAEISVYRQAARGAGRDLPVRVEALDKLRWKDIVASPPDSLPVWEVVFGPSEEVQLVIAYKTEWSGGCDGGRCEFGITYHARAARLWAGVVEYAKVRFEFDKLAALLMACHPDSTDCLRISATPSGYARYPSGFSWEMKNWEPGEDFNVSVKWTEPE